MCTKLALRPDQEDLWSTDNFTGFTYIVCVDLCSILNVTTEHTSEYLYQLVTQMYVTSQNTL